MIIFPRKPIEGPLTIKLVLSMMARYDMVTRIERLLEVDNVSIMESPIANYPLPIPYAPGGFKFTPMRKTTKVTGSFGKYAHISDVFFWIEKV